MKKRDYPSNSQILFDSLVLLFWLLTVSPVINLFTNNSNWSLIFFLALLINLLSLIYSIYRLQSLFRKRELSNKFFIVFLFVSFIFLFNIFNFYKDLSSGVKEYFGDCKVSRYDGRAGLTSYYLNFKDQEANHSIYISLDTYKVLLDNSVNNSCSKQIHIVYLPSSNIGLNLEIID